jgi:hypothetical protein
MFIIPYLEKVPYHPVKDLKWIMQFGYMNNGATVKNNSSFKKFKDLIEYARQNPNKVIHAWVARAVLDILQEWLPARSVQGENPFVCQSRFPGRLRQDLRIGLIPFRAGQSQGKIQQRRQVPMRQRSPLKRQQSELQMTSVMMRMSPTFSLSCLTAF